MRRGMSVRVLMLLLCSFLLLCCGIPQSAWSQYDPEQEYPVWLRGLLDVRIASNGGASSWTDRGPGKTRYGGGSRAAKFDRVTRFTLAQLAFEVGASLPWQLTAHAQVNVETDADDYDRPLLTEAFLRKEWGQWDAGWGLQSGVLTLPFSLEHTGPAWTPQYSLTPSALNSWLWEEIRLAGVEAEWWRVLPGGWRLSFLAGLGFGADQAGWLLAERGWILSDYLSGINADLPIPRRPQRETIFFERDHRPAVYTWVTFSDQQHWAELRVGYFDNLGDQKTRDVWETRFGTIGALFRPLAHLEVLVQYLLGKTQTHVNNWDSSFNAFYALASFPYRNHRFSVRYDVFRVHDEDRGPRSRDRGDAVTLAYLYSFGLRHRIGVEYIFVHSRHPALVKSDPSDDTWQISYRFRF